MEMEAVRSPLKRQYHAALAMLHEAIDRCPDETWYETSPRNAFWQVAYHALFFAHLYLQPTEHAFVPWSGHQRDNQNPDGIAGDPDPSSPLPLLPAPYSKSQVLDYWSYCDAHVGEWVDALNLESSDSGFSWYRVSKLEHQLVNLRHIQHHAAQLSDRLRQAHDIGLHWAGTERPTSRR